MMRLLSARHSRRARAAVRWAAVSLVLALLACAAAEPRRYVVIFGTDESSLSPAAQQLVAEISAAARDQHPAKIAVAGYGDGSTAHDAVLADRRAAAVIRALAGAGIDASIIERRPAVPADQATGIPVHKATVTFNPR
jgi:outer membrane protein OmpA-like peptidoglycan-associated protein